MKTKIASRCIGEGEPCFITFEAGPTHDGLVSAKRLAEYTALAGADAIKFQMSDPDRLVPDKTQLFSYGILVDREKNIVETVQEPLYDILKRRSLEKSEWRELKFYCDELGLAFFATVGFNDGIDFLQELGCHSIKIASADVNHFPLIRHAAKTGLCIQLDTGMSSLGEIEMAVDVIRAEGNDNIIIHHCPSGYPARLDSIHLNTLATLKKIFPYPIAFSDHTPGYVMDVAAIALGAHLVEKTITENRMIRSPEHVMSLEPGDMKSFVTVVRELEIALGSTRRALHPEEKRRRMAVRRSAFLTADAMLGTRLRECLIEFCRPGFGIPPDRYEELLDVKLNKNVSKGHCLQWTDLQWDVE
ncbi:MAG: N-acetylneuraminate synthase [Gammaproteobacteria bacterium RIFCSPHIGHO2_12_FULL_41_15]|nr:MAG: N-acetylneuraminate synthase [Gammaproteobacteria bacterium RIFCSPHIGHO2_12_FULL_41_15]